MDKKNRIRSSEEIGRLNPKYYDEKTNEAYATYCSLYLDFVNDDPGKFHSTGTDLKPQYDAPSDSQNDVYQSYVNNLIDIAKTAFKGLSSSKINKHMSDYPLLKQFKKQLGFQQGK